MSRPLLIIIADFLLLSLLGLARFDQPEEDKNPPPESARQMEAEAGGEQDLIEVLKLSLAREEESRASLSENLSASRRQLEERESKLEAAAADLRETKLKLEEETDSARELRNRNAALATLEKRLKEDRERLADRYAESREALLALERERSKLVENLSSSGETIAANKEKVRLLQEQIEERNKALRKTSEEIESLEESSRTMEKKNQRLITSLKIRETEKRILEQNLIAAKAEIEKVGLEKKAFQEQTSKLAEGVSVLAESSTAMEEKIRRIQPLSPNAVFREFKDNRVAISFTGLLSNGKKRRYEGKGILASDGQKRYLLLQTRDSPFRLGTTPPRFRTLSAKATLGESEIELEAVAMLALDPRVMVASFKPASGRDSSLKAFSLAPDPFRFPKAVLIGGSEDYYGESSFKLGPAQNEYLLMENKLFNRLFGEFTPRRGDLVFAKTGDFLGFMVNNQYCVLVSNFYPAAWIPMGNQYSREQADAASARGRELLARRPAAFQ